MVDTVVISLDRAKFKIPPSSYDNFTPSARGLLEPPYYSLGGQKMIKCVLNPTATDKKSGIYLPRLTLYKAVRANGISVFLHIEFSAPKVLFNNNFDELTDDNFADLCQALAKKIRHMGVYVFAPMIEKAEVKAIHYGKNVVLTDYTTASSVIADISKSNITIRKEADTRSYKNNGEAAHYFTSTRGVAIYDKVRELTKAKQTERGLMSQDNYCQLSLFDDHHIRKPFEVVRIEARYNNRRAITSIMAACDISLPRQPTFRELFSSDIAKQVVRHEFAIIKAGCLPLDKSTARSLKEFTDEISVSNPNATLTMKLKAIALKVLYEEMGSRDIRKLVRASSSQWSRLVEDVSLLHFRQTPNTGFSTIDKALELFTPVRIVDYVDEMIGVDI